MEVEEWRREDRTGQDRGRKDSSSGQKTDENANLTNF